jgi:hypothetical protein
MHKISLKVAKRLKKAESVKIINLNEYRKSKEALSNEVSKLKDAKILIDKEGYDIQRAVYVQAQNILSLLIDILANLPEFRKHLQIMEMGEDKYMPSWPPMSPISNSYFFGWLAFDIQVGIDKESMGSCIAEVYSSLALEQGMHQVLSLMNQSRSGIYKVIKNIEDKVLLEELFTQKQYLSTIPNKHVPASDELWLIRLLPPIDPRIDYYHAFTSPYLLESREQDWFNFFDRNIKGVRESSVVEENYEKFMRCGLSNTYWLEYITQAYCGHTEQVIRLAGIPDIGFSRPHFHDNQILTEGKTG